jgi:uncharacterized repeat protein (TIGR02543 family)
LGRGSGNKITINGGTITAVGGNDADNCGAGIGGGSRGAGGNITINGGAITAIGGTGNTRGAAGIGGGDAGNGGTITITGGTITATGGDNGGAGIGGGTTATAPAQFPARGAGANVTITGGSVNARTGANPGTAQAIGHGNLHDGTNPGTLTNGTTPVWLNTLTAAGQANTVVSNITYGENGTYGSDGVRTDGDGKLYFYLPASSGDERIEMAIGLSDYYAEYTWAANHDNESDLTIAETGLPELSWETLQQHLDAADDGMEFNLNTLTGSPAATPYNAGNDKTLTFIGNGSLIDGVTLVFGADNNITMNNLNIEAANFNGANNTLNLIGANTITAIGVPVSAGLTIGGTGLLDAQGTGIGSGGNITITGGTITASSITGSDVRITGGSINATTPVTATSNGTTPVWLNALTVTGQNNAAVTGINIDGVTYGSNGVRTDGAGKLYFYLPAGNGRAEVTIGGRTFVANYTRAANHTNQQTLTEELPPLAWNNLQAYINAGIDSEFDLSTLGAIDITRTFNIGDNRTLTFKGNGTQIGSNTVGIAFTFGSNNNITIENLNIRSVDISTGTGTHFSPLYFTGTGNNLTILGENTITSGQTSNTNLYGAAVGVPAGAGLTISGTGTLNARGGNSGAGIGGGSNSAAGSITIESGTVNATGGVDGAGIGGGLYGDGGTVTITGGTITATGGAITGTGGTPGTGIGNGNGGLNFAVTVNGYAVVFTNSFDTAIDQLTLSKGIVFVGNTGTVYGAVTLLYDLTIAAERTLAVPNGAALTIPIGVTLTNDETITNNGTITAACLTITGSGEVTGNPVNLIHEMVDNDVETHATCTAQGTMNTKCNRDGCTHTDTRIIAIDPDAHAGEQVVRTAATCTTAGIKEWDCCKADGDIIPQLTGDECSIYTITFDSDGGSSVDEQIIAKGGKIDEPAEPTKEGFTFLGWLSDLLEKIWDFATDLVASNTTLTAVWEAISSSSKDQSSSSETQSSSSDEAPSSSSNGETSINSGVGSKGSPEARQLASSVQTRYYNLRGQPLGTTKPTAPGVYLEKHGKHVRKIAVR